MYELLFRIMFMHAQIKRYDYKLNSILKYIYQNILNIYDKEIIMLLISELKY
jgi:hypothetical protein